MKCNRVGGGVEIRARMQKVKGGIGGFMHYRWK